MPLTDRDPSGAESLVSLGNTFGTGLGSTNCAAAIREVQTCMPCPEKSKAPLCLPRQAWVLAGRPSMQLAPWEWIRWHRVSGQSRRWYFPIENDTHER